MDNKDYNVYSLNGPDTEATIFVPRSNHGRMPALSRHDRRRLDALQRAEIRKLEASKVKALAKEKLQKEEALRAEDIRRRAEEYERWLDTPVRKGEGWTHRQVNAAAQSIRKAEDERIMSELIVIDSLGGL